MAFSSRILNQRKAADQKRALVERMQAALARKRSTGVDAASKAVEDPNGHRALENAGPALQSSTATTSIRYGGTGVRLYQDHSTVPLVASEPLAKLVDVYLDAAENRTAHQVLLWPAAPQVLTLVHVLATAEHWNAGRKAGLRTLFFPAKDNTFHPLNHLEMDRADLTRHARSLVQVKSLADKDPVLFRAVNTTEILPTINDLIPHFGMLRNGDEWKPYDDRILEHTLKKINRHSEKAALRNNCAVLGSPKTAPDAIFALGYQLGRDDLRRGFEGMKRVGSPDVCLLNATRALRSTLPNWQGLLKQFFGAYLEAYPGERPGLVVVIDDPGVGFRIRELVEKEVERATRNHRDTVPLRFSFNPIVCQSSGELGQCLKPQDEPEPMAPEPRKFLVEVKDADASRIIKSLGKIRQDLKLDEHGTRLLNEATTFLHKLAALPGGHRDVEAWLDEREADVGLRRRLAWSTPRGALVEFIAKGHAKASEAKLESVIEVADRLVANYFEATPMALAMAASVSAGAGSMTRVALVFTRPMHMLIAERFLRRQTFANGRRCADIESHLQFVLTKHVRAHSHTGWATRYVFVGIDDDALRVLMTENGIPADSLLLLTQRTALYTRWTLKAIYDQEEFRRFKPRLEHILRQLDEPLGQQDTPLLRTDDFVLPSFDFSATAPSREDDSEAWRIVIDGADPIFRSGTATVYVYDPLADLQSKSGFISREVRSLEPGQQLLIMSAALREEVEDVLQAAGVPVEHDKPFEQTLRMYHETILRRLNERFPGNTLSAQVALLKSDLIRIAPELAKEFSNIRHWVNLGHAPATNFEELRPQAPRHFKVFAAFVTALGLSSAEAAYFWQAAIHPIRVNRRIDGRYVSDVYARILFDPESAIVHAKLSQGSTASLFAEARHNVHTVLAVEPPATDRGGA